MKHLEWKIEDGGIWIEDGASRFEDFIMPHQHFIHTFFFCKHLIFDSTKRFFIKIRCYRGHGCHGCHCSYFYVHKFFSRGLLKLESNSTKSCLKHLFEKS